MAKRRQTYNLNRQTKLFDIHKQFIGGLKTIDTDDALGSIFLRNIDNLSLSEFGFLEKRYGTYINDEFPGIVFHANKPIQGYFEYVDDDGDVHKIMFYDGIAYIKNPKAEDVEERNVYLASQIYLTEPGLTYPLTNDIENDTGWQSGQFNPVSPTEPIVPPPPPGPISLIAKALTRSQFVIPGLVDLDLFAKASTLSKIIIPGNETIGLIGKSFSSKATIIPSSRFDVSLIASAELRALISTADIAILPLSAKSTTKALTTFEASQVLGTLSAKASGNSRFTFFIFESISVLKAIASAKSNINFNIAGKTITPTTSVVEFDDTSIKFNIQNNDDQAVDVSYEVATAEFGGTVIKSGSNIALLDTASAIGQFTGLDSVDIIVGSTENVQPNTTYWLRAVFAKANEKTISDEAIKISQKTDETPVPNLLEPVFENQGLQVSFDSFTVEYTNPNNVNATLRVSYAIPNSGASEGEQTIVVNAGLTGNVTFTNGQDYQVDPQITYEVYARFEGVQGFNNSTFTFNEVTTDPEPQTSVTATFNSNGGSPTYNSVVGFAPLTVNSPGSPTRSGFTFAGWSPSLPRTISANTTFTAQWTANTYTVTFNKQNGIGGTNLVTATFGSNMPSATAPTRSGFNFLGYFDATSGGTRYYNANMTSARTWNKPNNASLFARWAEVVPPPPKTATPSTTAVSSTVNSVTFGITNLDASPATITWQIVGPGGGAQASGSQSVSSQNGFQAIATGLSPSTTYSLISVVATASGKDPSDGATIRNLTTQAAPPPPTVTASFNSAGGSPTYSNQSGPAPLSVSNPGSPTRSGFTFLGWSPSVPTTINSNTTFTAQWQDDSPPPQCDPAGTFIGTTCFGFDLYEEVADGACGSSFNLIESNSTSCGYTPPVTTTYTTTAQIQRGPSGGAWFLSLNITYRGSSRSISTSSATTLDSAIAEGTSVTISAPSSVNYNGETYTFVNWRVNGANQSGGVTSITRTVNANTSFNPLYEPFGLGGF